MVEKKDRDVDDLLTEVTGAIKTPKAKAAPKPAAADRADKTERIEVKPAPKPATVPAAERKTVRIRQIRSGICAPVDQKQALVGLGLRRIRHEVVRFDTPETRGQILKVRHLVQVVGD